MTNRIDEDYLASEPWYRRMLGASSLSWQVVVFGGIVNFPQMVLTGGNLGARTVQPGEYPTIAAISAATVLVSFLYGYLAHVTVFRNRHIRPVSLTTFLVFYAVGGLLYSIGIQISDAVAGSPSSIPFVLRGFDAMLVSITWGIGVALILEGRSRFRQERDNLIEDLVAEQERSRQQATRLEESEDALAPWLESSIEAHLTAIRSAAQKARNLRGSVPAAKDLALTIDSAADLGARGSSHQMWEAAVRGATPAIGRTLLMALKSPRIWPAPMAVLVALGVPTVAVRNFGLWWGLPMTVLLGIAVWWWMRLVTRLTLNRWPTFLLAFAGTALAVIGFAILPAPLTSQVPGEIGSILVALVSGFLLVSFVATLQRERREVLTKLNEEVLLTEATRLAEARAIATLARRLHGPVQSTLRVCAAEIERAAEAQDDAAIEAAVAAAMHALGQVGSPSQVDAMPLTQMLSGITENWKGFLEVDVDIDPSLIDAQVGEHVADVVTEALSNSYHHGEASSATIWIRNDPSGIRVRITDNGSSESAGPPGLGTRLLRATALDFDLSIGTNGSTLDVLLPRIEDDQVLVRPKPTIE